jgi:dihydroxyacetone kinase
MDGLKRVDEKTEAACQSVKSESPATTQTAASASSAEELHGTIAVAAYYLAESRNFEVGHEMDDWLAAEAQVVACVKGLPKGPV